MNRNQLKYLAVLAMLIDHIAWAFVPTESLTGQVMHFIGRLTAPIMAYFLVEGYIHTQNVRKYACRLGIFAVISWAPFVYFEYGRLPIAVIDGHLSILPVTGVIYTLFLGLLAVWLWDKGKCPQWCKVLGVIGLCMLSVFGDWFIFMVLWCLFLYVYRDRPEKKWIAYIIIGLACCFTLMLMIDSWWECLFSTGIFAAPPLIQFAYNGKPGSRHAVHKWFFYVFYPLHLLLLGLLKWNFLA